MEFLAPWFRFTQAELQIAFRAMGMSAEKAAAAARTLAEEVSAVDPEEASGFSEFGGWLDPVASLSEDAASRVAAHRARWGQPQQVFELESDDGSAGRGD